MDEREELLSRLQDADACAEGLAITRPELSKPVASIRLQLAGLIEAAEALGVVR